MNNEWCTPRYLFEMLDSEFHFTLDPCSTDENALCEKHFTKFDDGLSQSWSGEVVFCNPPYDRSISKWISKGFSEDCVCVFLVPSRTDTRWFHDIVLKSDCDIRFVRGRLHFSGSKNPCRFPCMIIIKK